MKKCSYLIISALILTAILPSLARAEETSVTTNADVQVQTTVKPGIFPKVRETIRKAENIQDNEEARNRMLNARLASTTRPEIKEFKGDIRAMASSTRVERKEIRDDRREEVGDIRHDGRDDMRGASSTDERREIRKDMRKDIFEVRKQAITKQLTVSLNNLKQVRARISSRIDKAVAASKDMTEAKSLLVIADAKIVAAELAINSIVAFDPSSQLASANDATSSSTSTIDLTKPREAAEQAIKALKDAHKALVDVVRAVAHALGMDKTATTTPTTTVTATSTATTTTTI